MERSSKRFERKLSKTAVGECSENLNAEYGVRSAKCEKNQSINQSIKKQKLKKK